jgi:hypothetical protein
LARICAHQSKAAASPSPAMVASKNAWPGLEVAGFGTTSHLA